MDVIQLVKEKKGIFEWHEVVSEYNEYKLYIKVFRDAMKFNDIPAITWDLKPISGDEQKFNGVRLPATAHQLQQIADMYNCMLLTPKVIDLIWLQAELKFDCIINVNGKIVALSNVTDVHQKIEEKIESLGGDDGTKLVSCVGKYWCLMNELATKQNIAGDKPACNYGWFSKYASGPGITPGTKCWQRPGFRHNKQHSDPSQTIRLMYRMARLVHPNGKEESVDLHGVATNPNLANLIHHQGALIYLRQNGVPKLIPIDLNAPIKQKTEPKEPEEKKDYKAVPIIEKEIDTAPNTVETVAKQDNIINIILKFLSKLFK